MPGGVTDTLWTQSLITPALSYFAGHAWGELYLWPTPTKMISVTIFVPLGIVPLGIDFLQATTSL